MNFNLNKFVEDVARDNELCREFSKFEEMDEIYGYCKDMGIECPEDEFDESVSEYIYSLDDNNYKIDDDNLSSVAGGINFKNSISKTLAVVLSALTLGGSGFYGNVGAEEVSDFTNSSYKSEKVNSGKWSRTKKAISKFYNNHKKAIGLTLGAAIITGGILYNNHKVNNHKKELSGMSDEDIMKKIGKILPKDVGNKDSNEQLPEKNDKEDKKTKELKTGSKSHLEEKDKPLIDSSQNEVPKTVEEKTIETPKKTDISPKVIVDKKQSSIDANSADDTKMSKFDKSEQNTATLSKQEKASSASSESAVDKKQSSIDTNDTADGTPESSDKVSIIDQMLKGANFQKSLTTFKKARCPHRVGIVKPSEIGKNIEAKSETNDPPKEIAEPNDTTQKRESPVYGLGMNPPVDLSGLRDAASKLKSVRNEQPFTK